MDRVTDDEIAIMHELMAAATAGPWETNKQTWKSRADPSYRWSAYGIEQATDPANPDDIMRSAICYAQSEGQLSKADAELIVAAVNALPRLLLEIRAMRSVERQTKEQT
jgi:hypothetical protein